MAPEIPVAITIAAVSAGMPPILAEINIAMAAVTDFGAIDATATPEQCSNIAIPRAETIAVAEPATRPPSKGTSASRSFGICR